MASLPSVAAWKQLGSGANREANSSPRMRPGVGIALLEMQPTPALRECALRLFSDCSSVIPRFEIPQ